MTRDHKISAHSADIALQAVEALRWMCRVIWNEFDERTSRILTCAAEDCDPRVRREALLIMILGSVPSNNPWIIEILSKKLRDPDGEIKLIAIMGLRSIREDANSDTIDVILRSALQDSNSTIRLNAALAMKGDSESKRVLIELLKDRSVDVCISAAKELGLRGETAGMEYLTKALRNESPKLRKEAAVALGEINNPQSTAALISSLHDPVIDVRIAAVNALGNLKAVEAMNALLYLLDHDEDVKVRGAAAYALGKIGNPSVIECLLRAVKDPTNEVRNGVLLGLAYFDDPRCIETLLLAIGGTVRNWYRSEESRILYRFLGREYH